MCLLFRSDRRLGCFYEGVAPSPGHYEAPFRINLQVSLGRIQSNEEISMPFADFYPFSSFLDAVEIHIREKAADANGGSRPVVTTGQEHRRPMFEPALAAVPNSLRSRGGTG